MTTPLIFPSAYRRYVQHVLERTRQHIAIDQEMRRDGPPAYPQIADGFLDPELSGQSVVVVSTPRTVQARSLAGKVS